jgi:mannose/fructose/N-acetylgalactosamine-specific phosphotransferase system component IIC
MSASHPVAESDRRAAYTGLAIGALAVLAILFAVVKVTNNSFAHEEGGAKEAAEATK